MNRRVVALIGCTASGKTAVGEQVARAIDGEVVCADSRQVFRELDVGTGKPSAAERLTRPHHLFDALSVAAYAPGAPAGAPRATAGWYARAARRACQEIHARGRTPVLVGGSGLYLRAAQQGLAPTPDVDAGVRERLRAELAAVGPAELHHRLAARDPAGARAIHAADAQRITRALEVIESTGHPLGWWRGQPASPAVEGVWLWFELTAAPEVIRRRIAERTRWMFDHGLIEEARALVERGSSAALHGLKAIGYDEALGVIEGTLSRAAAEERTMLRTAQLAKRQRTWFRHQASGEGIATEGRSVEELADRVAAAIARAG